MLSREPIPSRLSIPEGKLLVAFSGGSDSLCLLYILSILAKDRTAALYVNHRIREDEELESEIALNRKNAEELGIPFYVSELKAGSVQSLAQEKNVGIEYAARELRYRELERFRAENGFDHILTAHHKEDQIETILMRILQNSPFYTYRGILREDGYISRPLLDVSKSEIMEILAISGLSWSEDSTNSDDSYLRNDIRHNLSSLISDEAKTHLLNIADNITDYRKEGKSFSFQPSYFISLDRKEFLTLYPFEREELLFAAFSALGLKERVRRSLILILEEKAGEGKGRFSTDSIDFFFTGKEIRMYRKISDFAYLYNPEKLGISPFEISYEPFDDKDLIIDIDALSYPCVIRTSREGDRIDLKGGSKLVSDLEREMHVPYSIILEDRDGIAAYFSRFLGGRDRLSHRLLGRNGRHIRIVI